MKLKNGFELDLQIENSYHGSTDECISSLEDIKRGVYSKWSKKELINLQEELTRLIDWRNNLLPTIVEYINNFGLNFNETTYFYSRCVKDEKFHDNSPLIVKYVTFGWKEKVIELILSVS